MSILTGTVFYFTHIVLFINILEKFVLPFRQKERPVYYHRRFERVPTIDQCEIDDPLCRYEANVQFQRDK